MPVHVEAFLQGEEEALALYAGNLASLQPPSTTPSEKASSRKRPPFSYLRPRHRRTAGSPEPKPLDLRGRAVPTGAVISPGCLRFVFTPERGRERHYILDGVRIERADGSTWIVDCSTGRRLMQF